MKIDKPVRAFVVVWDCRETLDPCPPLPGMPNAVCKFTSYC